MSPKEDTVSRSKKNNHSVDRRGFLAGSAAGIGALALSGSPLSVGRALAAGRSPNLPNFYPANLAPPDIPAHPKGGAPGYINFPKNLVKSVKQTPAKGGEVSSMTLWSSGGFPTPMERNSGWQQLNKELGTSLKVNLVLQADYAAKWGTVTAGGDLPDLMYVSVVPVLPNVAAFVNASCAELSSYLGGDAVKDYPNLANLPSAAWNVCMIDGKLWGVPVCRTIAGWPAYIQTSLLEKLGMAGPYPTNADDFKAYCKALTNPAQGRWAMGVSNDNTTGPYSMSWFSGIFRAPNNWRLGSNGGLVKDIETEEYKAALIYLRELVQLGYISPDVKSNTDMQNDLFASKIVMRANFWNGYAASYVYRGFPLKQTYRTLPPFGFDGKAGTNLLSPGNFGWTVIRKGSPERIKELLRVLDYLAAPAGSEEYMVTKFGVKGQDWDYDAKGIPQLTPQGNANMSGTPSVAWDRLCASPLFLFSPVDPDFAKYASAEEAKLIDAGVTDPTQGYYSPTDARKGSQLSRLIFDEVSGIAAGRKPVSDLDQLIKDWTAQGGDQMRAEYEKAIAS
jgi:putative aldouronate transport system substrate-binding protein